MFRTIIGIALLAVSLVGQGVAAIQVWDNPDEIHASVPSDCRNALGYNITCTNYLVTAQDAANGAALVGITAKLYCTKECHDSLQTFKETILSSCGKKEYQLYQNSTTMQSPAVVANGLVWAYDLMCIRDSSGFCLADLYNHTKTACSDCGLEYGAVMMSSDYGRNRFPPAAYSSLLSSCDVPASSYPFTYTPFPTATATSTTTTRSTSASATSTPICTGKTYISKEGDTCKSISRANSVSTDNLIKVNKLDYSCSMLSPGTQLCIQDACTVHTVQGNQTCQDIVKGKSFGLVQLIGWNPTIHQNCDNLDSMVGRSICVSPPGGGEFSIPSRTNKTSTGLPSSIVTSWVPGTVVTTMTNLTTSWYTPTIDPNYTPPMPTFTPNATRSSLLAERTKYCWITVEDEVNGFFPEDLSDNCFSLYEKYCDVAPTDPIPSPSPTAIPGSCTPKESTSSPPSSTTSSPSTTSSGVATPTPTQPNVTGNCAKFHKVNDGDTCASIADKYGIALDKFLAWNPDVGDNCESLWLDYYVCVGSSDSPISSTSSTRTSSGVSTPTPTQASMTDDCTKFHMVKDGDTCASIADQYGLLLADFLAWNPDVGDDCKNLWLDYYVCVSSPGHTTPSPTPTSTTSSSPATGATPTPTQPNMTDSCTKFYKVKDGDICVDITDQYGISMDDFLAWNPDVGGNCSGLWLDYYVCVSKS